MNSGTAVEKYFNDVASSMLHFFEGIDTQVPHRGERGGVRERRVLEFLRAHLPRKYGVGSGHLIDKRGTYSLQEDIVIYDALNAPILPIDDQYQLFPCEVVYATVEVKSVLDQKAIGECINHAEHLLKLDRGDLGAIENFVFAYDSYPAKQEQSIQWAVRWLHSIACQDGHLRPLPTVVTSLHQNFVLYFGHTKGKYIAHQVESAVLAYAFTTILNRLKGIKVAVPLLFHEYGWATGREITVFSYNVNDECHQ